MTMFHNLREASTAPDSGFLYSNTFLIRYEDEKVTLNHCAQFEALVNTQKQPSLDPDQPSQDDSSSFSLNWFK